MANQPPLSDSLFTRPGSSARTEFTSTTWTGGAEGASVGGRPPAEWKGTCADWACLRFSELEGLKRLELDGGLRDTAREEWRTVRV